MSAKPSNGLRLTKAQRDCLRYMNGEVDFDKSFWTFDNIAELHRHGFIGLPPPSVGGQWSGPLVITEAGRAALKDGDK